MADTPEHAERPDHGGRRSRSSSSTSSSNSAGSARSHRSQHRNACTILESLAEEQHRLRQDRLSLLLGERAAHHSPERSAASARRSPPLDGGVEDHQYASNMRQEAGLAATTTSNAAVTALLDVTALLFAVSVLKGWGRDGRVKEWLLPEEALSTLDILKKSDRPMAMLAREAIRFVERHIGIPPPHLRHRHGPPPRGPHHRGGHHHRPPPPWHSPPRLPYDIGEDTQSSSNQSEAALPSPPWHEGPPPHFPPFHHASPPHWPPPHHAPTHPRHSPPWHPHPPPPWSHHGPPHHHPHWRHGPLPPNMAPLRVIGLDERCPWADVASQGSGSVSHDVPVAKRILLQSALYYTRKAAIQTESTNPEAQSAIEIVYARPPAYLMQHPALIQTKLVPQQLDAAGQTSDFATVAARVVSMELAACVKEITEQEIKIEDDYQRLEKEARHLRLDGPGPPRHGSPPHHPHHPPHPPHHHPPPPHLFGLPPFPRHSPPFPFPSPHSDDMSDGTPPWHAHGTHEGPPPHRGRGRGHHRGGHRGHHYGPPPHHSPPRHQYHTHPPTGHVPPHIAHQASEFADAIAQQRAGRSDTISTVRPPQASSALGAGRSRRPAHSLHALTTSSLGSSAASSRGRASGPESAVSPISPTYASSNSSAPATPISPAAYAAGQADPWKSAMPRKAGQSTIEGKLVSK